MYSSLLSSSNRYISIGIKAELQQTENIYECERLQERITRLASGIGIIRVGANGYDNKGTNQVLGDVFFDGIPVFMANGLAANTAIATPTSNLHFATSLLSDMNEVKVLDMSDLDGSQNVRFVMRYAAGVQYGVGSDIVLYKNC